MELETRDWIWDGDGDGDGSLKGVQCRVDDNDHGMGQWIGCDGMDDE